MTTRGSRWAAFPLACMMVILICIAPARAGGEFGNSGKFVGWWELGGYYGTDDSSRGEAVLFTPLMQSATTLFFLDARGKLFEDDVQEANVALGYRQMMASGWNLGLWAGWDVRDTEIDNTFHQVSFGLEALSERFDLRLNGYVPVTDPKSSPELAEVFLRGNNILMVGGEELALHGVDGEVGMLLFASNRGGSGSKGAPAPARRHELRGYVGGFWFDDDDADEEIAGPKGRLEYRINDVVSALPGSRLTLESQLSHDEVRDTKFEVGARLRIPFGARGSDAASRTASLNAQELRMIEGLERDTDIVTTISKEENVTDVATNVDLNSVSIARNATQFANAVDAGGNRLIILQKGSQRIDVSATDGQQLQKNQTVQGGASTIPVRGRRTGTVAGFTAPGKRPTLFTDDINELTGAITVANNTHVAGLNIRGSGNQTTYVAGNHGIRGGDNRNNIVIEQMDIREVGQNGIFFADGNSNIRIWDAVISNSGEDGVRIDSDNRNVTLDRLDVSKMGASGYRSSGSNVNFEIRDSTFRDADFGVSFGSNNSDIVIQNVQISDISKGRGLTIFNNNRRVSVSDTVIRNTNLEGVYVVNDNTDVTLQGLDISKVGHEGIRFLNDNTNVVIRDTTIKAAGREGIHIENNNTDVLIANVKIVNPDNEGIDIGDFNSNVTILDTKLIGGAQGMSDGIETGDFNNVTIRNVWISDAFFDGIELLGSGNVVSISDVTIENALDDGFEINLNDNIVTMNNTTFSGTFGDNVIQIDNNSHTLAGSGNVSNASFGNQFCNSGAQTGSFGFDVGPQATCP